MTLVKRIIGGIQPPASNSAICADPAVWISAGRNAARAGAHDQAQASFLRAVEVAPESAAAHFQVAREHHRRGQWHEARTSFECAVALRPDYPEALNGLGVVLQLTGEWNASESLFRRALEARPGFPAATSNLATTLFQIGNLDEAEILFRRAIDLDDGLKDAHQGLAALLHCAQRLDEAEQVARCALAQWPDSADLRLNLGLVLLAAGRYGEGWPLYEARHASSRNAEIRRKPLPHGQPWSGEPLAGQSLHLVAEQGFGDMIQLVRYVPILRERGLSRLTFECPVPLRPLLQDFPGIDELVTEAPAQFDFWCFAMSVPRLLGTERSTIPAALPYLSVRRDSVEWTQALLGPRKPKGLRVGLAWKGTPANRNDANRSLHHLDSLAPFWSVPQVQFISLQKGAGEDEAMAPAAARPLVPAGSALRDFADTAAVIAQLDLVISVDTAVAHLSGALAKPTWVMLPVQGLDWRWGVRRNDSPWYPGVMRLFRQQRLGDWSSVIEEVRLALNAFAGERAGGDA